MFSLLHGLWKYWFQKDEYCIVLLGLDNAGKTTFLERIKTKFNKNYKGTNIEKVTATVGLNIGNIEAQSVKITFWDLGGQGNLQLLWDKYYSECHGIIYVIDSSDIARMDDSRAAFEKMIKNENLICVPLLLVANKQDLPDCLSLSRIRDIFKSALTVAGHSSSADPGMGARDMHAVEASALKGDGIDDSINWIVSCIKRNSFNRPPRAPDD